MLFRIARSREGGSLTHYDFYKVKTNKGMTVLDALFQIQNKMDESLAFRYSCRGAVCGSCAMLVNKIPRLACRTQVSSVKDEESKLKTFAALAETPAGWNSETEILIEPLPNLPIQKDLVV
ncbi:MAG: 2Fe-2S iron-sulfur cluster-binding protein, partial [Candidatus Hodarchaeota archaeon]